MNGYLVRALVALVFAALLWLQSRTLSDRPQRRRAFELAAGALLALAAVNGSLAVELDLGVLQLLLAVIGIALFLAAVATLVMSLRAGEVGDQREKIAEAAREYRARREAQERKKQ
jgi:heme A synthase